jgi:hypothetical protein
MTATQKTYAIVKSAADLISKELDTIMDTHLAACNEDWDAFYKVCGEDPVFTTKELEKKQLDAKLADAENAMVRDSMARARKNAPAVYKIFTQVGVSLEQMLANPVTRIKVVDLAFKLA